MAKKPEKYLVKRSELTFGRRGIAGKLLSRAVMSIFGMNKANRLYNETYDNEDYTGGILRHLDISYRISERDLANVPAEGPLVVICNHPTGAMDGIVMINALLKVRPDVKFMSNYLLDRIEPFRKYIILVDPFDSKTRSMNLKGLKECMAHLSGGGVLVIFPAGEVATWQNGLRNIADKEWEPAVMKFIRHCKVPVLPTYMEARNSMLFRLMGKIHPRLRTAMIPHELFNKRGKTVHLKSGSVIAPKRLGELDDRLYSNYLRASVEYLSESVEPAVVSCEAAAADDSDNGILQSSVTGKGMGVTRKKALRAVMETAPPAEDGNWTESHAYKCDDVAKPARPKKSSALPAAAAPIAPRPALEDMLAELDAIGGEYLLFGTADQALYCAPSSAIPAIMTEIGRLREITFRAVGEGTMKELDIDSFDSYYHQLFLWDKKADRIIGAYRIGFGDEITPKYGIKGFYTDTLFRYSPEMAPVLSASIELGRSFIAGEYQRRPGSLMMLWKGIVYVLLKYTQFRNMIGPVTISGDFTSASKMVISSWLRRNFYNAKFGPLVNPVTGMKGIRTGIDLSLIEGIESVDLIARLVADIEHEERGVPVLIKKYLGLGSSVLGLNVDPDFRDALDALMLLDMKHVPENSIAMLSKEITDIDVIARFHQYHE